MRADKQVYAKGKDKPICSGETMLELCEMDYFKPVKKWRGEMIFEMTGSGFAVERELQTTKSRLARED